MKKLILVLCLVLISTGICTGKEKVIMAAADPWPPYIDPEHPKEGVGMEIIRAAYKTQGYIVKIDYVPWARAEKGVTDGLYDILPDTWITKKRKTYLMFSVPYAYNEIKFIKRKEDPFEYNGLKSLTGKTVGTVRGYGYNDAFLKATNFYREEANNIIANVRKLTHPNQRIDLTLADELVARMTIAHEDPFLLTKIRFTTNCLSKNGLHLAAGLKNPRHKEIIKAFDKGLETIKMNGVYKKILENYGINYMGDAF